MIEEFTDLTCKEKPKYGVVEAYLDHGYIWPACPLASEMLCCVVGVPNRTCVSYNGHQSSLGNLYVWCEEIEIESEMDEDDFESEMNECSNNLSVYYA